MLVKSSDNAARPLQCYNADASLLVMVADLKVWDSSTSLTWCSFSLSCLINTEDCNTLSIWVKIPDIKIMLVSGLPRSLELQMCSIFSVLQWWAWWLTILWLVLWLYTNITTWLLFFVSVHCVKSVEMDNLVPHAQFIGREKSHINLTSLSLNVTVIFWVECFTSLFRCSDKTINERDLFDFLRQSEVSCYSWYGSYNPYL